MESRRLFQTGSGRIRWVAAALAVLFLVMAGRLFDLQVLRGEESRLLARDNRIRIRLVEPRRGRILDARGRVLAEDRPVWAVTLNFHEVVGPRELAEDVAVQFGLEPDDAARKVGSGWGDRFAPQVRRRRHRALLGLLASLAPVLRRPVEALQEGVRRAEDALLEREIQERVRLAGLWIAPDSGLRADVRKALKEVEERLRELQASRVPPGEFLLATGIRWELEREVRELRIQAYDRVACAAGCTRTDLARRIGELDRACSQRILRSLKGGDHELAEGGFGYDAVARLEMDGEDYPGVGVRVRALRDYPFGPDAAHVTGYVGYLGWTTRAGEPVNRYEERESQGLFWRPLSGFLDREDYEAMERRGEFHRDLFGKTGAEAAFEATLKGTRGARIVERDRRNRVQRDLRVHPATHGSDVHLTVDAELCARVREAFAFALPALQGAAAHGAAVVLDVETGAVLALVSVPSFDANDMVPPVRLETAGALLTGDDHPLLNRAVSGLYPPGSTFKAVSAMAALEEGILKAEDTVECTGVFEYGRHTFRCWNRWGHGPQDLGGALERSCNVYFYQAGRDLGDALRRWAELWGFGVPTGFDLPGEKAGSLPRGRGGDWVQQAIGQRMTATPLQVARLMAVIANGGRLVRPHVRQGGGIRPDSQVPVVSPATLARVREGLRRVVHGEDGTAILPSLIEVKAAGKTGTAETGRKVNGVSMNDAWFAGYAPFDAPRVAVAVVIEEVQHGVHGGQVAAPVAGQIFKAALSLHE